MTVSDHKCIVFNSESPVANAVPHLSGSSRILNELSIAKFSALFDSQSIHLSEYSLTNDLVNRFNSICLSTLNTIAPRKVGPLKENNLGKMTILATIKGNVGKQSIDGMVDGVNTAI